MLCMLSLLSPLSTQKSEALQRNFAQKEGFWFMKLLEGIMEEGRRETERLAFFSFQKTDIDFAIAIDFGLDSS